MDISSLRLRGQAARVMPQGPRPADDSALVATAGVIEFDHEAGLVRVSLRGGDVWLPAVAGRYSVDSLARVLLDATSGRPVMVAGPVHPLPAYALAKITAGPTGGVLSVTYQGEPYEIPAPTGAYTVGESAWVALDDWGFPVLAIGPDASTTSGDGGGSTPGAGGATVVATASIGPQVTGTWRSSFSRWDSWNPGRYGLGNTPIYQGDAYGSGPLIGFAGYGDQIVNLGATSIEEISMAAVKGADGNTADLTVQGTALGARPGGAPSAGPFLTASTGPIASGGVGYLALPAGLRESFRTGAAKGLVAVGAQYGGFGGFGVPPSFVLQIRYTRPA